MKKRKLAKKACKVTVALWLIVYIFSVATGNQAAAIVACVLIPVWAFLLWYGWDDSNITLADIRPGIVIDVVPTEVEKKSL